MKIKRPLIALDFPDGQAALTFLKQFPKDEQLFVKVGMELFYSAGSDLVLQLKDLGHDVFLDLKCHDIPHTVESAMRVLGKLHVDLTDVHAAGGLQMMQAAKEGLLDGAAGYKVPKLIAITQLTSSDEALVKNEQLSAVSLNESVLNYARLTKKAGLDGVVCSAHEAAAIKAATSPDFLRVTPGIRLADNSKDDQKRVMTPDQAANNEASAIVVGRAITKAADPVVAYDLVKKLWEGEQ